MPLSGSSAAESLSDSTPEVSVGFLFWGLLSASKEPGVDVLDQRFGGLQSIRLTLYEVQTGDVPAIVRRKRIHPCISIEVHERAV